MRRSWGGFVGRIPSAGRLGHHPAVVVLPVALVIVLMSNAGCGTPVGLAPGSPEARLFAPIPEPPGFDRKRALTPLQDVPDAPTVPATTRAPEVELPRQALRHLEEARRLFGEQRFSETSSELSPALRYNDGILEAHRMLALASLLSGNTGQAKTHAERALTLFPADAQGNLHYVLEQDYQEAFRKKPAEQSNYDKEVIAVNDRVQAFNEFFSGQFMRIVPVQNDPINTWHSWLDQN